MKRFSYLIPRIIILMLLWTAVWLAKDSLLRRAAVYYGQQLINAKVEISHLQTDWSNRRVLLKNVKVADPRNPMTNLIQADLAYLKFDPQLLWKRKFKITEGQIHGLVVNAPRTESGALKPPTSEAAQAISFADHLQERVRRKSQTTLEDLSERWLNQVNTSVTPTVTKSVVEELAQQTEIQWRGKLSEFKARAVQIMPKLAELAKVLGNASDFANPLRDRTKFEKSLEELASMQSKAAELRQALEASLGQLDAEMNDFDKAVRNDLIKFERYQASNQFDNVLISELLLSQEANELAADVMSWLSWFRDSLPELQLIGSALSSRGSDLCLESTPDTPTPDTPLTPNFVIEKLELEGNGCFARQNLNFIGTAYNLSSNPKLLAKPAQIDLRALGKGNVLISCIVDRTQGKNSDRLSIQFPELEFPAKQLGHEKCMQVTFGDRRRANADIVLEVNGADVKGTIKLRYSQAALHVDSLNDLVGGDETRLRINQGLSQLNQFRADLAITGTLDDYAVSLTSDLGTQFAKVVETAVVDRVSKQNQNLLQSIQNRSSQTTALVRTEIRSELQKLSEKLAQETVRIAQLKQNFENLDDAGWSKLR